MGLLKLIVKCPMRFVCKKKGHLRQHRNGLFGMFAPKYTWSCKRCGIRSTSDIDDMVKKGLWNQKP